MRRKRGIQVAAVIMGVLLLAAGTVPVQAKTVSELEQEKQELEKKKQDAKDRQNSEQQKLDSVTGTIGSIQGNVDAAAEEVEEVDAALVETIASVEIIEEELKEKEEVLQKTTADYEAAKETEQKQYDAMKLRIRFMYEKGDSTYLQLLLESQNFGDMVNKADYVEQLYSYDRKMLEEYQRVKQETEDLKNQLEDEKAELQAQQHELEEEQKSLTIMLNEKKKHMMIMRPSLHRRSGRPQFIKPISKSSLMRSGSLKAPQARRILKSRQQRGRRRKQGRHRKRLSGDKVKKMELLMAAALPGNQEAVQTAAHQEAPGSMRLRPAFRK